MVSQQRKYFRKNIRLTEVLLTEMQNRTTNNPHKCSLTKVVPLISCPIHRRKFEVNAKKTYPIPPLKS